MKNLIFLFSALTIVNAQAINLNQAIKTLSSKNSTEKNKKDAIESALIEMRAQQSMTVAEMDEVVDFIHLYFREMDTQPTEKPGLLEQIKEGVPLKPTPPQTPAPKEKPTGRQGLLEQIREGKKLKKTDPLKERPINIPIKTSPDDETEKVKQILTSKHGVEMLEETSIYVGMSIEELKKDIATKQKAIENFIDRYNSSDDKSSISVNEADSMKELADELINALTSLKIRMEKKGEKTQVIERALVDAQKELEKLEIIAEEIW